MFKMYTKEGCLFQCRLERAFNYSGCIPWDYPIPPSLDRENTKIKMCNSLVEQNGSIYESDLAIFHDFMNTEDTQSSCNCQPNCEEVIFESQVKGNLGSLRNIISPLKNDFSGGFSEFKY